MTKEDYMMLPKERLAELLAERDIRDSIRPTPVIINRLPSAQCWEPDGICTNPFHDCINCPKVYGGTGAFTTNTLVHEGENLKSEL